MSLTVGSLFSGAGLLDFGLEQAGMKTIWQVEYDDWCREVALPQNFPNTEKFNDVRKVGKHNLRAVDVICGGFPCQDVSISNLKGKGLDGERSGLWSEMFRIICELRPRYALIENVSKLVNDGLVRVLSDIASIGYDAEWQTLRASDFGLPHRRERLFIAAYTNGKRLAVFPNKTKFGYKNGQQKSGNATETIIDTPSVRHPFIKFPEHLRMDNGIAYELSEIERAIKAYGNGVAIPVASFIGEQIIRFDNELKELD